MTTLRCMTIDDERLARLEMTALLTEIGDCCVVGEASNVIEAKLLIEQQAPDVIFLDINMPGANGFELLTRLDTCPLVVFVTAYDQYAIRAFEVHALDYLLKPVRIDRLKETIELIRQRLANSPGRRLFIPNKDGGKFIQFKDIFLVRAYDHYVRIYHEQGSEMLHQSLKDFTTRLPLEEFFPANRSEVIRVSTVTSAQKLSRGRYELQLPQGETVTVSERQSVVWRRRFGK